MEYDNRPSLLHNENPKVKKFILKRPLTLNLNKSCF